MITTCWETGLICPACEREIILGEETLYGQHLGCAREAAQARRQDAHDQATLTVALAYLKAGGRIMLTRAQLRELVTLACAADEAFAPVRRPDKGMGPIKWYGRLAGWDPARVQAGLSAPEVAGLWLDYMDVGRTPPIRHRDLTVIIAVIGP